MYVVPNSVLICKEPLIKRPKSSRVSRVSSLINTSPESLYFHSQYSKNNITFIPINSTKSSEDDECLGILKNIKSVYNDRFSNKDDTFKSTLFKQFLAVLIESKSKKRL